MTWQIGKQTIHGGIMYDFSQDQTQNLASSMMGLIEIGQGILGSGVVRAVGVSLMVGSLNGTHHAYQIVIYSQQPGEVTDHINRMRIFRAGWAPLRVRQIPDRGDKEISIDYAESMRIIVTDDLDYQIHRGSKMVFLQPGCKPKVV